MALARTAAVLIAQAIYLGTSVCATAATIPGQAAADSVAPAAGVFVLGGIHQTHEEAKLYTYERMGELHDSPITGRGE